MRNNLASAIGIDNADTDAEADQNVGLVSRPIV
jgi:hypothetical protein